MKELLDLFESGDVDVVPVVAPSGELLGIVTKLDVLRIFRPDSLGGVTELGSLGDRQVGDVMRPGVVTLEPGDPLAAAVDLMLESRLHGLPVVERRRGSAPTLVGMVSRGDLLRALTGRRRRRTRTGRTAVRAGPASPGET
jgi:CBS domain-containing protein